jgi:hypothetical protein
MKYVVLNESTPILFPDHIKHSFFKDKCLGEITSGAFLYIDYDTKNDNFIVRIYGEAQSLNLKPNYELDEKLINHLLRTANIYK